MALTKVITGVTDLNQAQSTNGLKFPTGSVFAGTPEEGMIRNDQSQSSETSSSTMQFYNGTAWKNFVNKIFVPLGTNNFNTVLYTGNGGTQAVSTVGFQPDFTWIKSRTTDNHVLTDSVRGVNSQLFSNLTNGQSTLTTRIQSFDTTGFTAGSSGDINNSGTDYVAWSWKAGGADVLNEQGSVDSQVSANVDAGFSIVKYTGASFAQTVGHGLSKAPEMVIVKRIVDNVYNWVVCHIGLTGFASSYIPLNTPFAEITSNAIWNSTDPTSTVFTIGTSTSTNRSNETYIAYAFHSVAGYSKIGSYTGNAGSNTIVTGFEPAFVMIKKSTGTGAWFMHDNKRLSGTGYSDKYLQANSNAAEVDSSDNDLLKFDSNGFTLNTTFGDYNASGATYIYMAFAAT